MASRYWVGGTADWDGTAGTKWSSTSGGAGGAAIPLPTDDVFFDASSGSGTVTVINGWASVKSLTTTGFTGTITSASEVISANGDVTIGAGTTWTTTGLTFAGTGTGTITTNGKTILSLDIQGGGTFNLGDALTVSGNISIGYISIFSTNNNNISSALISFAGTSNISLGSSTLTVTGYDTIGSAFGVDSGVVLSSGTSTIKLIDSSANTKTFNGGGKTYYNLWFAPGAGTGPLTIVSANTFNDIKDDGTVAHTIQFPALTTQTVSSFTVNGNAGQLISLLSSSDGSRFTLSKASGTVTRSYLDIKDSAATGGAIWQAGAGSVNSGNNTGWIFPTFSGPPQNLLGAFAHILVR